MQHAGPRYVATASAHGPSPAAPPAAAHNPAAHTAPEFDQSLDFDQSFDFDQSAEFDQSSEFDQSFGHDAASHPTAPASRSQSPTASHPHDAPGCTHTWRAAHLLDAAMALTQVVPAKFTSRCPPLGTPGSPEIPAPAHPSCSATTPPAATPGPAPAPSLSQRLAEADDSAGVPAAAGAESTQVDSTQADSTQAGAASPAAAEAQESNAPHPETDARPNGLTRAEHPALQDCAPEMRALLEVPPSAALTVHAALMDRTLTMHAHDLCAATNLSAVLADQLSAQPPGFVQHHPQADLATAQPGAKWALQAHGAPCVVQAAVLSNLASVAARHEWSFVAEPDAWRRVPSDAQVAAAAAGTQDTVNALLARQHEVFEATSRAYGDVAVGHHDEGNAEAVRP